MLAVAQFMVILDATIVNIALPHIQKAFSFHLDTLSWVLNAYTIPFAGLLLLGGRLADLMGRRRVFVSGLLLFAAGSLLGGLAPDGAALVGARAAQGVGAAMLSPAALALLTAIYPMGKDRDRAMGVWMGLAALGGTLGVVLGGLLVGDVGWRAVFYVNVPVALVAAGIAGWLVPESRDTSDHRSFDTPGAVTVTLGLLALVYAVTRSAVWGWTNGVTLACFGASALLLATFVAVESRARRPLVPLGNLGRRALAASYAGQLLLGATFLSTFFVTAVYLEEVQGMSAVRAGLAFLPMGFAAIVGAGMAAQLTGRLGVRAVFSVGAVVLMAGLVLLGTVPAHAGYVGHILPGTVLLGLGIPWCGIPTTLTATAVAGNDDAGLASGLLNTAFQVGAALGLATLTTVAADRTRHVLHTATHLRALAPVEQLSALTSGFRWAYLVALGLCAANLAVAAGGTRAADATPALATAS